MWPKTSNNLFRNQGKRRNESKTTAAQFVKGCMTIMLRHFLTHPFPESFDRIQVRAVARKQDDFQPRFGGSVTSHVGVVPGRPVPDDDDSRCRLAHPLLDTFQERGRALTIEVTFIPDQTLVAD